MRKVARVERRPVAVDEMIEKIVGKLSGLRAERFFFGPIIVGAGFVAEAAYVV
jgi:hypothetical protein